MKITQKLMLWFFVIILLIVVIGYFSVNTSQRALQMSIGENSASLVGEVLDKIDRAIFNRIERWESYSSVDRRLLETVLSSNQEFEKLDNIQAYINMKDREWVAVSEETITPFMQQLINNELSERLRERIGFYEGKYAYRVFGEVFITNKYGANVAQTGKTSDYRQDDEEWWQLAKRDGLYVADVEYDRSASLYSLDIGIRIDDENGNFVGVMKVVLNIEEVINILGEAEATVEYEKAHFRLINKGGKVLYSTKEKEFEFLKDASDELLSHLFKDQEEYKESFIGYETGEQVLFVAARSEGYGTYKGLGWILVMGHDTNEIFAPVTKLKNTILLMLLVSLVFIIPISLLFSFSISKPMTKLRDAIARIGKGELDVKIDIESKDEMGELASAFRQMARDLKQSRAKIREHEKELEKIVEKRTKELNKKIKELEKTRTAILNILEDVNLSKEELEKSHKDLLMLNKRLEDAIVELKRMDKYKNEFISITAHELKTPLASIHGFSSLLQKKKVSSNVRQRDNYLKIILEDTERLKKLIDDILDLSKLDLGTMKFFFEKVSVKEVFKKLVKEMYILAAKKGLVLRAKVADNVPSEMITDEDRLFQVLINLVNNAVKYTSRKGGRISVTASKSGKNVLFTVSDTGAGIEKKNFDKIFDRFFQCDYSYTRKVAGSGLGLAVCRGMVEALGGKIWVNSKLSKGSTFSFTLPVESSVKGEEELKVFKRIGRELKIRKPKLTGELKETKKSK